MESLPIQQPSWLLRMRQWLRSDMLVLRWVFLILYVLLMLGLIVVALLGDAGSGVLMCIGVMLVAQALFVFGSGTIRLCHPIRKRRLILPIIASSVMLLVLLAGFSIAMMELLKLDNQFDDDTLSILFFGFLAISWITWGVLLFVYARTWERYAVLMRISRMLFVGSLLELMATVPSHIIVIRRDSGCLVGIGTMLGIVAGVGVMLFSFGPMLVVLFLRPRHRAERAARGKFCDVCGYDLRASVVRCPECGTEFALQPAPTR